MLVNTSQASLMSPYKVWGRSAVGANMWCLSLFFTGTIAKCKLLVLNLLKGGKSGTRQASCSFEGDIVWISSVSRFMRRFWFFFSTFFRSDYPFRVDTQFSFSSLDSATIFAKCAVKNFQKSKNRRKRFCAGAPTSCRVERFEKNSPQ